jgi:hypothetical protein
VPPPAPQPRPHLLPARPAVSARFLALLTSDFTRFASTGLPPDLERYVLETYGVDVSGRYAGLSLRNPWGKASGQLSMRKGQVEEDAAAGLGFVVLKTVIAQDARGVQSMAAWAVQESRMVVEPIAGVETGAPGWTVSWKGRGWWQSLDDYLGLVRDSVAIGRSAGMVVAPSVKYHLRGPHEHDWREEEYVETTRVLLDAFRTGGGVGPMPLEKDFSPTLAGSERSKQRAMTLEWLAKAPALIRKAIAPGEVRVGLKLFNSLEGEEFQLAMLSQVHDHDRPDYLIYANRLFDPARAFEGQQGIAHGGPDLSDRNLRVLSAYRASRTLGTIPLEISGTGDIHSGKMAVEYALRGCTSFQIHTLFQLPADVFDMARGGKVERALHQLYFHPESGLVVWLKHAAARLGVEDGGVSRLTDVAARGARSALRAVDLDT